jgi:hypothetical protein
MVERTTATIFAPAHLHYFLPAACQIAMLRSGFSTAVA